MVSALLPPPRSGPAAGASVPRLDIDLYSRRVLAGPVPYLAAIRAAGPVVWLPRNRLWVMGRYADVHYALRTPEIFASGHGVAANFLANAAGRATVLFSDAPDHARRRRVLLRSLAPRSLTGVEEIIGRAAEAAVARLAGRGRFDGVRDFAAALPLEVIADLVGCEWRTGGCWLGGARPSTRSAP